MNKKGFTLIELIVVISIIALVATIFTVNTTRIFRTINESNESKKQTDVELAADAWLHINYDILRTVPNCNSKLTITINKLIDEGFLKKTNATDYPEVIYACRDNMGVIRFS